MTNLPHAQVVRYLSKNRYTVTIKELADDIQIGPPLFLHEIRSVHFSGVPKIGRNQKLLSSSGQTAYSIWAIPGTCWNAFWKSRLIRSMFGWQLKQQGAEAGSMRALVDKSARQQIVIRFRKLFHSIRYAFQPDSWPLKAETRVNRHGIWWYCWLGFKKRSIMVAELRL